MRRLASSEVEVQRFLGVAGGADERGGGMGRHRGMASCSGHAWVRGELPQPLPTAWRAALAAVVIRALNPRRYPVAATVRALPGDDGRRGAAAAPERRFRAARFWLACRPRRVVVIQDGHRVVESGPYRLLRHPSYTGGLVAFLGTGIALDSWLSILALVFIPLVAILVRIRVEEAELATASGRSTRGTPAVLVGWSPASGEASNPSLVCSGSIRKAAAC